MVKLQKIGAAVDRKRAAKHYGVVLKDMLRHVGESHGQRAAVLGLTRAGAAHMISGRTCPELLARLLINATLEHFDGVSDKRRASAMRVFLLGGAERMRREEAGIL